SATSSPRPRASSRPTANSSPGTAGRLPLRPRWLKRGSPRARLSGARTRDAAILRAAAQRCRGATGASDSRQYGRAAAEDDDRGDGPRSLSAVHVACPSRVALTLGEDYAAVQQRGTTALSCRDPVDF